MLFNYYKIALRHLKSVYALINILGLTIGFAVFTLIFLWVNDELSFDRFHADHSRIFRVVENQFQNEGVLYKVAITPPLLCDYIKTNFADVEDGCRAVQVDVLVRHDETAFYQKGMAVDPSFFSIFSFPIVNGSIVPFGEGIDKMIVSEKMATAYFGSDNPLGKVLKMAGRDFAVIAVVRVPDNSHLKFDFAVPLQLIKALGWESLDQWDWNRFHTYIKLKQNVNPLSFNSKIKDILKQKVEESTTELELQRLTDIHLRSTDLNNDSPGRHDIQYVYIFISAALFILLIACINYTNMATARSIRRAKEAGVRKVVGASRWQLMTQYFSESLVSCLIAFGLALLLVWMLLPWFNDLSGKTLSLNTFSLQVGYMLGITVLSCGFLTGIFPALFLSSLKPVIVLKGLLKTGRSGIFFRRTSVIVQFALSIVLVLAALIVDHQMTYIRSKDMGYNKENILMFHIIRKLRNQYGEFKQELKSLSGIVDVTVANANLSFDDQSTSGVTWEGKNPNQEILFHQLMVDHDFVKTFSMQMVAGRSFSESITSDSSAFILNEEAVAQMNSPKILGSIISLGDVSGPVIGIVKNFNFKSAHKKIEPMIIYIDPQNYSEVSVRLQKGEVVDKVKAIEKVFKKFCPDRPFEYTFLDQDVDKLYKSEQRTGKVFTYFSALAIFISALGLLSILMFTTEQRKKEMALRKVMGASVGNIFLIVASEFIWFILIGNAIALPIAISLMNRWLGQFAYYEKAPVSIFIVTAICSFILTLFTVSFFCSKAARTNPVDSLRSE